MGGAEGAKHIAEALKVQQALKALNLAGQGGYGCNVDVAGAKHIAEALKTNTTLTEVNLKNNALCGIKYTEGTYTSKGISHLAEAPKVNKAIKKLILDCCRLCGHD